MTGPNYSPTSACATGANAVTDGAMYIKAGKADAMIVGGSEAVEQPLFHACFESMRVLAPAADPPCGTVKPFDLNRAGFVPGEGGAALLVEELEHAQARGARIYAEVVGTARATMATTWPPRTPTLAACSTRWDRPSTRRTSPTARSAT